MTDGRRWYSAGGVVLTAAVAWSAGIAADFVGETVLDFDKSPISAIMMAIVIGMLVANTLALPAGMQAGLRFCTTTVLKLGIMLLGIRLSLLGAGRFTLVALPFVVAAIAIGLVTVRYAGRRLGLSRELSGLIAVGTSICGCTAIVATAPLIRARDAEVSYAVTCITVFGLAAMFAYPWLAHAMFGDVPAQAGLFLGTAIHETAQVAGAGLMYEAQYASPVALDIATVTKLVRNLCMLAVIPLVGALYAAEGRATGERRSLVALLPWFILGFAAMSALRTVGDLGERPFGLLSPGAWAATVGFLRDAAEMLLLVAMAGVGLTSKLSGLRDIGPKPFLLGLFAASLIGAVSLALIGWFAPLLLNAAGI